MKNYILLALGGFTLGLFLALELPSDSWRATAAICSAIVLVTACVISMDREHP